MKRLLIIGMLVIASLTLSVSAASAQDDIFLPPGEQPPPITTLSGGPIEIGVPIEGFIEQDQRIAYDLMITETTGLAVSMQATDTNPFLDTYVRVFDADGNLVVQNDDDFICECLDSLARVTLEPGSYTVEAATFVDFDTGQFVLTVSQVSITEEGIIGVGSLFENELAAPATDVYELIVSEGQPVRILFDPLEGSSLSTSIVLYDEFGILAVGVVREPDSRALSLTTFFLEEGSYRLEVIGLEGSGGYSMVVGPPATDRGFLPLGEPIRNELQSGERARYQLVLSAADNIHITVISAEPFDPTSQVPLDPDLVLLDEQGFEMEFGDLFETASGQLGASISRRFEPGTYTIEVRDFADSGSGEYILEATPIGVEQRGPITIGAQVGGTVNINELDSYTLSLAEPSVLRFALTVPEGSSLDPVLSIYDGAGFLVYDNAFAQPINGVMATSLDLFPGDYILEVAPRANETAGDYVLTVENAVVDRGVILVGESIDNELIQGRRDRYTLTLTEAEMLEIAILSQEGTFGIAGFDPVLTIYDANGNFLYFNDDFYFSDQATSTTDSRIMQRFEAGTYLIEVASFFDEAGGLYAVSVDRQ